MAGNELRDRVVRAIEVAMGDREQGDPMPDVHTLADAALAEVGLPVGPTELLWALDDDATPEDQAAVLLARFDIRRTPQVGGQSG